MEVGMTLDYTEDGKVAFFVVNRPEAMNALDVTTLCDFHRALADFRHNPRLQAGIITGVGDEAFCTGIDIRSTLYSIDRFQDHSQPFPVALVNGFESDKPLIAAINGLALGGGMDIALSCDIRIASKNARFHTPEAALGLIPAWGGTRGMARSVHWCQSAEMLLTGRTIDAQEAYQMGLVNRVVPRDQLISTAKKWAEVLCDAAPQGIRFMKGFKNYSHLLSMPEAPEVSETLKTSFLCAEDFYEGIRNLNGEHHSCLTAR
jgi:E-phenylitaconyl-CoA hydratase